jgi:hypothetical protein
MFCTSLASIDIPNSVLSIGGGAFYNCKSLDYVIIGSGVQSIGPNAFNTCTSLISINIPNIVQTIGEAAFQNCTSLASVAIGSSVTSIGPNAFAYCMGLDNMTFAGPLTNAEIGDTIFLNIEPNNTRTFRFNTYDSTLINANLLYQIKLTTQNDRVSSTGPQIFILPTPPTYISNGTELLAFLTTNAEYGNINNNNIVITPDLINTSTSNILKILMNNTNALISITKN